MKNPALTVPGTDCASYAHRGQHPDRFHALDNRWTTALRAVLAARTSSPAGRGCASLLDRVSLEAVATKKARRKAPPAKTGKAARALKAASRPIGKDTAKTSEARTLARNLDGAFTEDELRAMLVGALLELDKAGHRRLVGRLGAVTGAALARMMGLEDTGAEQGAAMSPRRVAEDWRKLWAEWDKIIDETTKDGRYVQNEISYNTPDLDEETLSKDLDTVAARLRPLLPHAFDADQRLALGRKVVTSLDKIASDRAGYIIRSEEGLELGPEVTGLLLEGLWLEGQRSGKEPFHFLVGLHKLSESLYEDGGAHLDLEGAKKFVRTLDKATRKAMAERLEARREKSPWNELLDDDWSFWPGIIGALG